MNATVVDLNIAQGGEIATPLSRLLQEIEILMTADRQQIVTDIIHDAGLGKYLFKVGLDANVISSKVNALVLRNISTDYEYDIDVQASFLNGRQDRDILYIEIIITLDGDYKENLIYNITP